MVAKDLLSFPDLRSKQYDDKEKTDFTSHPSAAFTQYLMSICCVPGRSETADISLTLRAACSRHGVFVALLTKH